MEQTLLPACLVDLGRDRGFVLYQDIQSAIPDWNVSEVRRSQIIAQLTDVGIVVHPEAPELSLGLLVELESVPEEVSLALLGTGRSVSENVRCRFSFICDKRWSDLDVGSEPLVRFCQKCEKEVKFCMDVEEAREAILRKECVALMFSHTLIGGDDA